jgi:Dolichyl-phosphate-mannose-protein mannosyltransferase
MTADVLAPTVHRSRCGFAVHSLRRMLSSWRSLVTLGVLVLLTVVWQFVGMANAPQRIDDEGTYVAQAYALQTYGTLGHYTYWYDHPPFGWMQLAFYTATTDAFNRTSNAVLAGREAMLGYQIISCVLLWVLCRRLLFSRSASALAVGLFSLSPLAVQFHRTVYLDNIATPWILAALVLALSPQRRLWSFAASGACFAGAVLTKETSLLLAPAVAMTLWRGTAFSETRRYALSLAASSFAVVSAFYVLYAAVKNELLPGKGHVSLIDGIEFQLVGRTQSGSIFDAGSASRAHVASWLHLDPVFPTLAVLCLLPAVFVPRIRPIAVGLAILLLTLLRPGYVPVPYVIGMLPLGAILIAGVADAGAAWVPRRWRIRRGGALLWRPCLPLVVAVGVVAGVLAAPIWISQQRGLFRGPLDAPLTAAEKWIKQNVPHNARLAVDDSVWVDLVRAGYPRQNVVWYYKIDTDPAVKAVAPGGWRDYDYVLSTESVREDLGADPQVAAAVRSSVPMAIFGAGSSRVEVRRVVAQGLSEVTASRAEAIAVRRRAGLELLTNRRLQIASSLAPLMAAGKLDLRAEAALATLASDHVVRVSGVPIVASEQAAGQPARSLDVASLSPAMVSAAVAKFPPAYQPISVTQLPAGGARLVWAPTVAAILPMR